MLMELLIGVASGVLTTAVVAQAIKLRQLGDLRKVRIFEPSEGQLNKKFYDYFCSRINEAKEEIIVTGEGFEFKGADGPRIAKKYHAAMQAALENEVHVIRFQTLRPLNPKWAELLGKLLNDHQAHFHLYIVDNSESQDIASVCVIDESRRSNVTEFMLSAERDLENTNIRVASTGLFFHGRGDLARAMKRNVMAMRDYESVTLVEDREQLQRITAQVS